MQKKFILNLTLLIFLNLLVKPFYILGIDTEVLNRVGQSEYGTYFALMSLAFLMNIFMDMGIVNFNTSNIAKNEHLVSKHFSSIFTIRITLSFFYLALCLIVATFLSYQGKEITLLLPICINQILAGFILYIRSNLSGLQQFERDSVISVIDRLLLIVFCSSILWGNAFGLEMSIELFIYLQTLAYSITFLIALYVLKPYLNKIRIRFNLAFNALILRKSFPYALLILLMGFYYRTDGVMLERLLENGAYEAGIYAQAFRFFEAGNMLAYLFVALLFPMFSRLLGKNESVEDLLSLAFRIISVGAIVAGMTCYYYAEEIMNLRFSSEIEASARAFRYLMVGFMGICGTYVFGALLTANENLKELNIMASIGVVMNIALNFLLIPKLKAEGAAMASMITQISMTILQIYLVYRVFGIGPGWRVVIRFVSFLLIAVIAFRLISWMNLAWSVAVLLYSVSLILTSFLLGLLSYDGIHHYLNLLKRYKSQ